MPLQGPGTGGRIGTSLTRHMMQTILKDTTRDEDPREAILRHAEAAKLDPLWIAPAYEKSQPKTIFAEKVYEHEDEEKQDAHKKRRQ